MFFVWEDSLLLEDHMLKVESDQKSWLREMDSLSKQPYDLKLDISRKAIGTSISNNNLRCYIK